MTSLNHDNKKIFIFFLITILCKQLPAQNQNKFELHLSSGRSFIISDVQSSHENGFYFNFGLGYEILKRMKLETNIHYFTYPQEITVMLDRNIYQPDNNYPNLKLLDVNIVSKLYISNRQFFTSPYLQFGIGRTFILNKYQNYQRNTSGFSFVIGLGMEFNISKQFRLLIQSQGLTSNIDDSNFAYILAGLGFLYNL